MGNSSPPAVTSRSRSLGGSSGLHRQLGRVVSPPLPSGGFGSFLFFPSHKGRDQISVWPWAWLGGGTWASLSLFLCLPVVQARGFTFFHVTMDGPYLNAEDTPLSVYFVLPVCHVWPPLHWHLRKCRLLICYWSFFTLIFSNYLGKETGMRCF